MYQIRVSVLLCTHFQCCSAFAEVPILHAAWSDWFQTNMRQNICCLWHNLFNPIWWKSCLEKRLEFEKWCTFHTIAVSVKLLPRIPIKYSITWCFFAMNIQASHLNWNSCAVSLIKSLQSYFNYHNWYIVANEIINSTILSFWRRIIQTPFRIFSLFDMISMNWRYLNIAVTLVLLRKIIELEKTIGF